MERSPNQQFGVYNKEEKHLGDIIAHGLYFTEAELREQIGRLSGVKTTGGLSMAQLHTIESDLGVYLRDPVETERSPNQQFGVYDEDEKHAGDIIARGLYFTETELREQILRLFS